MGQDRGPLRLAKTVLSNGLGNLPSLHKDQGGLKADLMTTMKEVPRLHDLNSVKDRLGNDRGEYISVP
jgi:hypothetical protein